LVGLFSDCKFNKIGVTAKADVYLRYLRDQYKVHLKKKNLNYELPPVVLEREWKALVHDVEEKAL